MKSGNVTFSDIVALVERHFKELNRNFSIRRAETLFFSPVGNYESLEIHGLLDGLNDVTVVVNMEWMGEDAKARYMVSECTEVKRAEFHDPVVRKESITRSSPQTETSENEPGKKAETKQEVQKPPLFSGSIQQSQLNHLKALRIRKTHNLTDEDLKKLSVDQANELIEGCTKALRKKLTSQKE